MRQHGTRACYVFGPESGQDRSRGCRCEPCVNANRQYARQRLRLENDRKRGDAPPAAYVDATEAREHLRWLRKQGVGTRAIERQSGVARSVLQRLAADPRFDKRARRRATQRTIDRILLVAPIDAAPNALVDAGPTWRRIDDLLALGYSRRAIASAIAGKPVNSLQLRKTKVTARNAAAVKELHARWMPRDVLLRRRAAADQRATHRARERERESA